MSIRALSVQSKLLLAFTPHSRIVPAPRSLLPTTEAGWYLHYHYLVHGGRPYGQRRRLISTTDRSPLAGAIAAAGQSIGPAMERLGLENVVLVDPASLEVVYSLEQTSS